MQVHSVGWTDRYFVAILQTSTTAGYDAMRAAATATAEAVQRAGVPVIGVDPTPRQPDTAPTPAPDPVDVGMALERIRKEMLELLSALVGT